MTQGNLGKIDPVVLGGFPDEGQVSYFNAAALVEVSPAVPGHAIRVLRLVFRPHFNDGQMRHVGPFLAAGQAIHVQQVVDLPHAVSGMRDPDEYGRSDGNEGLDLAEGNLKRFDVLAAFFKGFKSRRLVAGEVPGGKQGQVGSQMREFGVKLTPEGLDELPNRISDIGD